MTDQGVPADGRGETRPRATRDVHLGARPAVRTLTVRRRVIGAMARAAAEAQPGVLRVGRGGAAFWARLAGPSVTARLRGGRVHVRLFVVARSGESLGVVVGRVRRAIAETIELQLGLDLGEVTVLVDGVGD
ncbi:MAG: Asp23/Gls24 family envelope stress response protein [Candidatus Limnocylindrales bacterium]